MAMGISFEFKCSTCGTAGEININAGPLDFDNIRKEAKEKQFEVVVLEKSEPDYHWGVYCFSCSSLFDTTLKKPFFGSEKFSINKRIDTSNWDKNDWKQNGCEPILHTLQIRQNNELN